LKTNRKTLRDNLTGPRFITPLVKTVNQMAKMINGLSLLSGGDVVLDPEGIMLRVKSVQAVAIPFLWELYQEDDDIPGLLVSMRPGVVGRTNSVTLAPSNLVVSADPVTATDDATTRFWVKVSVEAVTYQTFFRVWVVTGAVREHGATVPTNTLDIPGGVDGDLFYEIGSVTAADGEITGITQLLRDPLAVVFPLSLVGPETGIHTLVSDEGVIGWAEHEDDWTCPEDEPPEE